MSSSSSSSDSNKPKSHSQKQQQQRQQDQPISRSSFALLLILICSIVSLIFSKAASIQSEQNRAVRSELSKSADDVLDDPAIMASVDDDAIDQGLTSYERAHKTPEEVASEPVEQSLAEEEKEEHSDLDGDLDYHLDKAVKQPKSEVDNCKKCAPVKVPEMCSYQPKRMMDDENQSVTMKKRKLLRKFSDKEEDEEKEDDDYSSSGSMYTNADVVNRTKFTIGRKLLKGHQAFQTDRNRELAKSRQPDFKPPTDKVRAVILKHYKKWQGDSVCTMWTRACVKRVLEGEDMGFKRGPEQYFKDKKLPGVDGSTVFPDLKRGELGTCALVAVADNMLGQGRGPQIDNHDTVFRYNGPLKAYKKDIGVKGDVYYWKQRRDEQQYGVEGQKANKYYMWKDAAKYFMFGDKKEFSHLTFRGKQLLWETPLSADMVGEVYGKYHEEMNIKTKHASTGGFKLAMSVLASGLCTRLDLYGFSSKGGGRYFKNAVVNTVHLIGLEHYALRVAMEEGYGVCVYD
jgi:hypothetical protein